LPEFMKEVFGVIPEHPGEDGAHRLRRIHWVFNMDVTHHRMAMRILEQNPEFDLMLVQFRGTDVAGHSFWRFAYPERFKWPPAAPEIEKYGSVLDDYYAHLDRMIGSLQTAAGPQATVLVISDHGMSEANTEKEFAVGRRQVSGGHDHAPPGVLIMAGPAVREEAARCFDQGELSRERLTRVGSILDITPTILAVQGLPVGRDMDGRPLVDLLDAEHLLRHPLAFVASHDVGGGTGAPEASEIPSEAERDRLEELRSLGYIE